jgi:two-component system, response regulator, stage 0 sporulation protein F
MTMPTPLPKLRVFLAEDDPELRQMIAGALRRDGHFVLEARDGLSLLADIGHVYWQGEADPTPSLVITDVRMPERDGMSVLRGLRGQPWCPRFIIITGFGDEELHAQASALGAEAVFDKPFDLDDLRALVLRIAGAGAQGAVA